MLRLRNFFRFVARDERGLVVSEYALVVGVLSSILLLGLVAFSEDVRAAFDRIARRVPRMSAPAAGKAGRPKARPARRPPAGEPSAPEASSPVVPVRAGKGKGRAAKPRGARQGGAPARRGRQQQRKEQGAQVSVASRVGGGGTVKVSLGSALFGSSKTWPRWASQVAHRTSVRRMPRVESAAVRTWSPATGSEKLGQPVPESNLAPELNSSVPQPAQR
jgi:Flp pilus assembly pilin Flp